MNRLYLIRHGRTRANLLQLYCGSTDLPLSEQGMEELQKLTYEKPEALYLTSGMLRTEQTLQALFGPVPHGRDPRFREVDFGIFEMKSYEQLKDTPAYQRWLTGDNLENVPPEGESGRQMEQRVLEGLRDLQSRQQDVILVTHGGVIACLMASLFPEEGKNRYQWQPEPGHGYLVTQTGYVSLPE